MTQENPQSRSAQAPAGTPAGAGASPVPSAAPPVHEADRAAGRVGAKLNWLRAGVLGANDGIVSVAGVVIGVAAASPGNTLAIASAGLAALVAGAFSMAGGEYVSVSTQRDTERALLDLESRELREMPEEELGELAALYEQKGLSPAVARQVAEELTAHDALAAHADIELGIRPDELTNPWHAAISSFIAFFAGALIPLIVILLPLSGHATWITVLSVVVGLVATGWISAALGEAPRGPAIRRNVVMGTATMAATYLIGLLFGVAVG